MKIKCESCGKIIGEVPYIDYFLRNGKRYIAEKKAKRFDEGVVQTGLSKKHKGMLASFCDDICVAVYWDRRKKL